MNSASHLAAAPHRPVSAEVDDADDDAEVTQLHVRSQRLPLAPSNRQAPSSGIRLGPARIPEEAPSSRPPPRAPLVVAPPIAVRIKTMPPAASRVERAEVAVFLASFVVTLLSALYLLFWR